MKIALSIATCCTLVATAAAGAHSSVVNFENGWEGWSGSGATLQPSGGNPGAHAHTQLTNFGIEYQTSSNAAFLGDYTQYSSVTLSIDVKANVIDFYGSPVSRKMILDLRSMSQGQGGYPYSSVWISLGEMNGGDDWTTYSVTFDPNSSTMPAGWGGTGAEDPNTYEPMLPSNLTFGDIMSNIEAVSFSTYEPGWMYSVNTYFDLQIDNIRIEATQIPAPGAALALLGLVGLRGRRRRS